MRHVVVKRALVPVLVLCILVVGGLASAQSITHESQHSHHQKSTHSTILCSWMCAAGQTHDASFAAFEHDLNILAYLEPFALNSYIEPSSSLLSARAPPRSLA